VKPKNDNDNTPLYRYLTIQSKRRPRLAWEDKFKEMDYADPLQQEKFPMDQKISRIDSFKEDNGKYFSYCFQSLRRASPSKPLTITDESFFLFQFQKKNKKAIKTMFVKN